ncbi:MAG: HD-GYP domain-containing protein, partial [Capsulimonadales bacterium]|nr:HD-GYP domain-containing protein [Capsulimonadales bacterium]
MKVRERRRRETTQNESELTEIGSFRRKGRKTSHIGAASPLPIGVRLYLVVTCLLGIVCATLVFTRLSLPLRTGSTAELIVFIVLSALAGNSRVLLPGARKGSKEAETGTLSLGFAMIFVTMLRFGPQGALLAGFASTVASSLRPRQPWYQFLFNIAVDLIRTSVAGTAFLLVNGGTLELRSWTAVSSVGVACLSFFAIHTGMMAIMVGGFSGRSPISIWRESFLRTAPSYVIAAAVSTVASVVIGNKLLATLLCAVPIALLTHASFRSYLKHAADLIDSKEELATLYLATIRSLALAIDAKDQYTHQHILRVQQYAVATALALNIDGDELKAIETGALLHDIGKLGVPEYVLLKPGRLTEEEENKIREHPRIGADILDPVKFPWPVLPVVKHHHERWDGSGYPDGLRGESIPRTARILSVADVYDALTSSRSYRAA